MLLVYYLFKGRARNAVLFLGSIFFYAWGNLYYGAAFLVLILLNYLLARAMRSKSRVVFLVLAVLLDVGVLAVCKLLEVHHSGFILPLGISFLTFKMISFQADLYRGELKEVPDFLSVITYFSLFFQIPEGPIMRYSEGFSMERRPSLSALDQGLCLFAAGLSMKVLLADRLSLLWNEIFRIGYESVSTPLMWLFVVITAFRLYFDFWGYSLMASGIGVMLGFPFIRNFNNPYGAASVTDFYRRWHITLGTWLRDYIYIPVGGSRRGTGRTIGNLALVWLITAAWHGITPPFFLWGLILLLLILWEKFVLVRKKKLLAVFGRIHVLFLIPLTWLIFSAGSLSDVLTCFGRLFPFFGVGQTLDPSDWSFFLREGLLTLAVGAVLLIPRVVGFLKEHLGHIAVRIALTVLFWISIYHVAISGSNPFLYIQF
ncbi:MAG: MBOAT family protein [Lachnospiraceae bacterium]|nr:MBOAT family protein [Lachnospiraceae bacterium]